MDEINRRIEEFSKMELEHSKNFDYKDDITTIDLDVFAKAQKKFNEMSKRTKPHGSSPMVLFATRAVAEQLKPKATAYNNDSDYLVSKGEKQKAEQLRQQYLMDEFLPAVEAVVEQTSPDELLNSKEALRILDRLSGTLGGSQGFTEAYVKQAYGDMLGQVILGSDETVRRGVFRIKALAEDGDNRVAVGIASKLKRDIDDGKNAASEDDYALISRVVAYAG